MIRVTIFNEYFHEKESGRAHEIYPNGIHTALKEQLEDENIKTLVYHIVFEGMLRKTEELTHKKKSKGELR